MPLSKTAHEAFIAWREAIDRARERTLQLQADIGAIRATRAKVVPHLPKGATLPSVEEIAAMPADCWPAVVDEVHAQMKGFRSHAEYSRNMAGLQSQKGPNQ